MSNIEDIYYPVKNGKLDYAYDIATIMAHKFNNEHKFLQGVIAQDTEKMDETIGKRYFTVSDFMGWLQTDIINSKINRNLYEIIPTGQPVRPYFDIEYDGAHIDDMEMIDMICNTIINCFSTIDIEVHPEDFSIFTASGDDNKMPSGYKSSFHIILNTKQVFKNTYEHKLFVENIILPYIDNNEKFYWTDSKGVKKCIFDSGVYNSNQSFRLPYQSKFKSTRILEQGTKTIHNYCIGLYCDPSELEFIELPFSTEKPETSRIYINEFKHKESPEFERVKALTELLTKNFVEGWETTRNLVWALWNVEQTERMYELIHSICSKGSNYEYKWVNDIIDAWKYGGIKIQTICYWAEQCAGKDAVSKALKQNPVNYKQELFTSHMKPAKHTLLNQRYLGDSVSFTSDDNTIVIKSHLGTGKTVCISNIIRNGNYKRILVVSPRKSYTNAQQGALDGFTSYLDRVFGDLATENYLIIQVESLHRIGNGFKKYDLVILDEIESILNQLHSIKTNAGNLITNHEVLGLVVSSAKHVILADAFISDRTFNFCNSLRDREMTHYYENTHNPYKREAICLQSVEKDKRIANIGGFCERVCEALRAGKKIVIVWTSKRKGDWFVKNFLENWVSESNTPSWIFYNSASSKEEQEGLKNVNESWRDVQCLMMTTSITVGISYDPKIAEIEFDEAFLYGSSASAMPRDIAQSLFRVRNLKANRLTYVLDTRTSYESGVRGFNNIWNELAKKEDKLIREHPVVKWTTCPLWARWNYCWCENEERSSRAEYQSVLEEYLVQSGYTIKRETHIPSQKVASIKIDLDDKEALLWNNIDDIDSSLAEEIHKTIKRGEASGEQILQRKKWLFRCQFKVDCSEEEIASIWSQFFEEGCEKQFWNVVHEKCWTVDDLARSEAIKRYALMSSSSVKERETIERFLKIVGMSNSQEEILIGTEKLNEIGIELCKCEKEIVEGLGLRQSRRKGEWKVANTIDLIKVVLESWGCGIVESIERKRKINKKTIREYSLQINNNNIIWDKIYNSNINYDINLFNI
jgi:hypothetical protein